MSDTPRPDPSDAGHADDRLQSWKEIAAHLGRDARTVQRWERQFGLPVYRNPQQKRSAVYALRQELDAWLAETHAPREETGAQSAPRGMRAIAGAGGLLGVAVLVWLLAGPASVPSATDIVAQRVTEFWFTSGQVSPDGRWLAYRDADRAYLRLRALTSSVDDRLLVDEPVLSTVIWAPDSDRVACAVPEGSGVRYEVVDIGSARRRIATRLNADTGPTLMGWTATGNGLVLTLKAATADPHRIVGFALADGAMTDLGTLPADARPGTISPDGRLISYTRPGHGRPDPDIYVHSLESGHDSRITDDPRADFLPVWAPDSRTLVFLNGYDTDPDRYLRAVRLSEDGGPAAPATTLGTAGDYHGAAGLSVSHTGDVFVGRRVETFRTVILDVDPDTGRPMGPARRDFPEGSEFSRWLDDDTLWYRNYAISGELPFQRLLVERRLSTSTESIIEAPGRAPADPFRESSRPGLTWLYRFEANSRQILRRRSGEPNAQLFVTLLDPIAGMAVSPDESTLAVVTYHDVRQLFQLSFIDVPSRRVTRVAQTRLKSATAWSPDSRAVAFIDGPCLLVADRRTAGVEEVTCAPSPDRLPIGIPAVSSLRDDLLWLDLNVATWSSDGSHLAYAVPVGNERRVELRVVDRRTGGQQTIFSGEADLATVPRGPAWSPGGNHIGFVLRTHSGSSIWTLRGAMSHLQ